MSNTILIYYEQIGYGGVDTHMAHLINNWPNKDSKFIIISNPDNEGLNYLESLLKNTKVEIVKLNDIFINLSTKSNKIIRLFSIIYTHIMFIRKFPAILNQHSPDIFISNNGGYPGGITHFWAAIIGKKMKKTKVHTFLLLHHAPVVSLRGFLCWYTGLLVRWVQSLGVPMITVSEASKNALQRFTPLKDLQVIYNGLEIKCPNEKPYEFRSRWHIPSDKLIVGMLGPIDSHKGHSFMLEIYRGSNRLQQKSHLVIVGSGSQEMIDSLQERVQDYGLEKMVTITGFLSGDANTIVSGFDMLVMPTTDFEGFGYSMAEAMAAGIPVVASRVGAIPEIIENGVSGILIEPNDIENWRKQLENLLSDNVFRKVLGNAGKKKIENEFSATKMSQLYFDYVTTN